MSTAPYYDARPHLFMPVTPASSRQPINSAVWWPLR